MKNTLKIVLLSVFAVALLFIASTVSNAAEGYTISLDYDPTELVAGEERVATATLAGTTATPYAAVRLKVDVKGPATPQLIATDKDYNVDHDIAIEGYWGPVGGFQVGGDFKNDTPIRATFPKAGTYEITISLVDVNNSEAVIVTETFNIEVGLKLTTSIDGVEDTRFLPAGTTFESLQIADPEKEGYTFAGWYTDAELTAALDETAVLDEATTVYAKFDVVEEPTNPEDPENPTAPTEPTTPGEEVEEEKDETPNTGVSNYVGIVATMVVVSIIALAILKRKNA